MKTQIIKPYLLNHSHFDSVSISVINPILKVAPDAVEMGFVNG